MEHRNANESSLVTVVINGETRQAMTEPRTLLAYFIRENLGMTGTHVGCDTTSCGACTVLMDGVPVKSCTVLAVQADHHALMTVEGLESIGGLHPLQQAFWDNHGLQCGFCTLGMLMTSTALLRDHPEPTETEVRHAISGNLCRCTGYVNIVKAIVNASQKMASEPAEV